MAYFDEYNVQFLDLTGVDEDERNWILKSLQIRDSTVKGPWNKLESSSRNVHKGADINNSILPPRRNYEHYQTTSNIIVPKHINAISQNIYPGPYQQTLPVYPPAFVPPVQYQAPMVAVKTTVVPVNAVGSPLVPLSTIVPVNSTMVPINTSLPPVINNPYPQQVTYPTFHMPPQNPQLNVTHFYDSPIIKQEQLPNELDASNCNVHEENVYENKVDNVEVGDKDVLLINLDADKLNNPADLVHYENGCCSETTHDILKPNEHETKSWASLFNKKSNNNNVEGPPDANKPLAKVLPFVQLATKNSQDEVSSDNRSILAEYDDPNYYRMGEILVNYSVDHRITSLQPRGLINRSNYCYINSILQAMLACPPVYNLLYSLQENINLKDNRKHTQIIDNMVKFVNEFQPLPPGQRVNRRSDNKAQKKESLIINCDGTFEPYWIYKMLNGIRSDSFVVEGRQEDAEEFLGCLLNGLNDEMLELMKLIENSITSEKPDDGDKATDGDKEWQVIGPKNKGCVTRRTELVRTPISDIFGGHIRSRLYRAGDQITDNIQPFFTLQLNIEKVNTVREALEALVCKNQLEGVTSSKTNEEVEAWQQVTIEELPVVLILHLKCFDFKMDGCTKIIKALEFPVDLKIDSKLLSSKSNYQAKEKQYKLFAVVYHDGKEATKGHYVTDAYHIGYASWICYDDTSVKAVKEEDVLKPHGTRVPYLLFYRRSDTVRSK